MREIPPETLSDEEAILLAKVGDRNCLLKIWESSVLIARGITRRFSHYSHVDPDDLQQNLVLRIPHLVTNFNPNKGIEWRRWIANTFFRRAQDELRKLDPLGIKYPQRKEYPGWQNLGGLSSEAYESVVINGLNRIDRELPE